MKGQPAMTDAGVTRAMAKTPIENMLEHRQRAAELGDVNLVREINVQLGRAGYREPETATRAEQRETATPPKARR